MSETTKTYLVTGASSGIGEATAKRLAREPGAELVLVARREERLRALAESLPCEASWLAVDLTDARRARARPRPPRRAARRPPQPAGQQRRRLLARLTSPRRATPNVHRHMELNFDAVVRLTEALLPLLRASTPSAIVNVASTAGRVARARTGAYSASKFALIGWTDCALRRGAPHGVHVGMVLPGFIATEGFPATELRERALTRWTVSKPEKVAEAIVETGLRGKAERYVPRPYALAAVARILAPGPGPPRALRRRRLEPDDEHRCGIGRLSAAGRRRSAARCG